LPGSRIASVDATSCVERRGIRRRDTVGVTAARRVADSRTRDAVSPVSAIGP